MSSSNKRTRSRNFLAAALIIVMLVFAVLTAFLGVMTWHRVFEGSNPSNQQVLAETSIASVLLIGYAIVKIVSASAKR